MTNSQIIAAICAVAFVVWAEVSIIERISAVDVRVDRLERLESNGP